ncbi:MAG: bifunctional 23S rRNA (guanine(2069)-N(7))-methyltransferase RlmK/23S rRNA (guanine(2445)-N(2))-methyltransferase RlmL [Gammaproteobacteria bacterium]|nr:bifunctional 23S rRNA (guanine(2069)-N(7))-methyltransferase RlmK/23S rRNA (guanine(2445)-N(2))-methyltransferase RlmL [Gammaproteobacteria bacterium]
MNHERVETPDAHEQRTIVTCPKGLESLLADELTALGAHDVSQTKAGVYCAAELLVHYRICMHSRLANRILYWLHGFQAEDSDSLYAGVKAFAWHEHLSPGGSIAVDFNGTNTFLRNTYFSAQRVKDAINDHFAQRGLERPTVATAQPDLRINAHLRAGSVSLRLDLSGASLHRRGYRKRGGAAPLKENLAAAILIRAGWPTIAAGGGALIDPLCGSGTLLIEGLELAMGLAPGRRRQHWGFDGWLGHIPAHWRTVAAAAGEREAAATTSVWPDVIGYDGSGKTLDMVRANIAAAGLEGCIRVHRKELGQWVKPTHKAIADGLIVCNPPYGARLGDAVSLASLYRLLGEKLRGQFRGWQGAVFTGNPELGKTMGLRARKQFNFFNGSIAAKLLLFDIDERWAVRRSRDDIEEPDGSSDNVPSAPLSAGALMFANRVKKNMKHLARWRKRNNIQCYRVYDADLPEYAVAVDVYGPWFHVAEYQAPASVEPAVAKRRLLEAMSGLAEQLGVRAGRVVVKERRRQKGKGQYQRLAQRGEWVEVMEGSATLLINLHDYLDTGLFLDHRKVRLHINRLARGKRFLNLFCYTGAATVHAGLGGAEFSTNVDLSATYINWAERNAARNGLTVGGLTAGGLTAGRHRFVRADVMSWLRENREQYDLIFVDPPTFSNSKNLEHHFDVQRDHAQLLAQAMRSLAPGGLLIFSCNRRRFALADEVLRGYAVEDMSRWSLDKDFERARFAHHCWFIRHQ